MSKRQAIEWYRSRNVSTNEAARIAAVSLGEWFEIAREEGLRYQLSPEDVDSDAESARKL